MGVDSDQYLGVDERLRPFVLPSMAERDEDPSLVVGTPVALAPHPSNDQDVAPPGSWTRNAVALVGVTR